MSATIEITPIDDNLWSLLTEKASKHPMVCLLKTENTMIVDLYKQSWDSWRDLIMNYAKDHTNNMYIVLDRDGDEINELIEIEWDGKEFHTDIVY